MEELERKVKEQFINQQIDKCLNNDYGFEKLIDNIEELFTISNYIFDWQDIISEYVEDENLEEYYEQLPKKDYLETIQMVESFYKSFGREINVDKLVSLGIINPIETTKEDESYTKKASLKTYLSGETYYDNSSYKIDCYNNGSLIDSLVLVHELNHYNSPIDNNLGNILCEVMAYSEEFIYLDYLSKNNYKEEGTKILFNELSSLIFLCNDLYLIILALYIYKSTGKISKENYDYLIEEGTNYEDFIEKLFESDILQNKNIYFYLRYELAAFLAPYLFLRYVIDPSFYHNIIYLSENIDKVDIEEAFKIMEIDITKEDETLITISDKSYFKINYGFNVLINKLKNKQEINYVNQK